MAVTAVSSLVSGPAHPVLDLAALKRGNLTPAEQRQAVSQQFEAILLRQFLKDSVGAMMGGGAQGGSEAGGGGGSVYGYMLTDAIAQKLAEGGGMGLAPMIARQLTPAGTPATAPAVSNRANQP